MKTIFSSVFFLILVAGINVNAQISVSSMNVASLKDAPFKYKGARVMMSDRVDDASTKNIFLFTKPVKGTLPDTLFVQKYTKVDEVWNLAAIKEIVHNGAISLWQSRKGFIDGDQDKQVDAFFIYSLHNADASKQQSVHLLLVYKNDFYTLSGYPGSDGKFSKTVPSSNFSNLNAKVKAEIMKYWEGLDKD